MDDFIDNSVGTWVMVAMRGAVTVLVSLAAGVHPIRAQDAASTLPDTIDVVIGSPLIDWQHARPYSSRFRGVLMSAHDSTILFSMTNEVTHYDSGGVPLIRVYTEGDQAGPNGVLKWTHGAFVLHRRTLAFYGSTGEGALPGKAQPNPPAFYGPAADILVEFLPRRVGVVYRAKMWQPGAPAIETHLYETRGQEDIEAFGKRYQKAWVIEDKDAASGRLASRMWLIPDPPYMVRWEFFDVPGKGSRIEVKQGPMEAAR